MASSILDEIILHKRSELAQAMRRHSLADLESLLPEADAARGFIAAISGRAGERKPAVIAEIKKASPSKGLIRADFDPASHARDYAKNGASCLSILTDEKYFQGHAEHLKDARAACSLPVIRKDFMIDPYQIIESRAMGADCILLIVAALSRGQLQELFECAQKAGLDALIEVHNEEELELALDFQPALIGVNNRDLHSFTTRLETTLELRRLVPKDAILVTESGINSVADVQLMLDNDVFGFLIGESFMRAPSPGEKLRELFASHG